MDPKFSQRVKVNRSALLFGALSVFGDMGAAWMKMELVLEKSQGGLEHGLRASLSLILVRVFYLLSRPDTQLHALKFWSWSKTGIVNAYRASG